MSWETEFEEFYTDEVTRSPYTGQDGYGQPSHGVATIHLCRVVHKPQVIRQGGTGEVQDTIREVISTAQIYTHADIGWDLRDKVTLADGASPKILQIVNYPDEDGPHHSVVFV
jgi:hypothetical protein